MTEKQKFSFLEALIGLTRLAQLAYWKGEKHCGSDFQLETDCPDCQHFEACLAQHILAVGVKSLTAAGE